MWSRSDTRSAGCCPTAQHDWQRLHADARARVHDAADRVIDRVDDNALTLTREQGKPVPDSRKEILFGADALHYYAEQARRLGGTLRASSRSDIKSVVSYAPVGLVAAIVPWNYPVDLYCWKVAPVLAAGCAVIAKPPPQTPLAIGEIVTCLAEAGVPRGVLADLPGGADVGAHLVAHPDLRLITVADWNLR